MHSKTLNSYYSPFPREKSNKEVLKRSYAKKIDGKKTLIDIPPTVTVSYMKKNPYYFDLKKSMKTKGKNRPKSSNPNGYTVYDNKKLEVLLNTGTEKFIAPRPKLNPGCEVIESYKKKSKITPEQKEKLTSKEILSIINKIKFPTQGKSFGKVPK